MAAYRPLVLVAGGYRELADADVVEPGVLPFRRNAVIGGDFSTNPWQRGVSFAAVANLRYTADLWLYEKSGSMVHTVTKDTDVPTVAQAGRLITHSLRLNLTTADTSIAATDYCFFGQRIEGFNFAPLAQQSFVVSFWVKATMAGIYHVNARNAGSDRSYVSAFMIVSGSTWEFKTVVMTASPVAGTWDYTTALGLHLGFTLAAGSTFQTSAGAWQTGNFLASSSQVNGVNTGATDFRIAAVQSEPGSVATPFETMGGGAVLADCQRYYEVVGYGLVGRWASASEVKMHGQFAVHKRTGVSLTLLTTTPTIEETGVASRTGAGSTITAFGGTVGGFQANINGFTGATAATQAFSTTNSLLACSNEP